jgi:hypothetical protein
MTASYAHKTFAIRPTESSRIRPPPWARFATTISYAHCLIFAMAKAFAEGRTLERLHVAKMLIAADYLATNSRVDVFATTRPIFALRSDKINPNKTPAMRLMAMCWRR